ncbi:trehalose monomycolate transport factor TtfA [Rhodococcus aerolatus]
MWFTLAGVVLVAAVVVLLVDQRRRSHHTRVRQAWSQASGARHTSADPVITAQWRHGPFAHGGAGRALDLVTSQRWGATLHVFDLEQRGQVVGTLVALRRPVASATVLELRTGDSTPPRESEMDLLGPVGSRFAFTTDLEAARRAVDERLVTLAEEVGEDVDVVWAEGGWALAVLRTSSGPERWEQVAGSLSRFGDLLRLLPPA